MVVNKTGVLVKLKFGATIWTSLERLEAWREAIAPGPTMTTSREMSGMIVQIKKLAPSKIRPSSSATYVLLLLEDQSVVWSHNSYIKNHPAALREDYASEKTQNL